MRYPMEVFWSDEDEGFLAIAPDLRGATASPSLSFPVPGYAPSPWRADTLAMKSPVRG